MSALNTMDPSEFEQLYHHHHSWLHGLLSRRLGNNEDAADFAQDAFIRLWHRPTQLDTAQQARAYLSVIARGLCVDLWRHRQVEQSWLDTLANLSDLETPSAEHQVALIQTLSTIDQKLKRLPDKVAKAFILSMLYGKTGKEIATELAVSERMVRHYLSNATLEGLLSEVKPHYELPD